MIHAALDNDVLIKGSSYGLLKELINVIPSTPENVFILGASKYVVPDAIRKIRLKKDHSVAIAAFEETLNQVNIIEPDEEESKFAAELEAFSIENNLALDTGESQLLAIVYIRSLDKLVTGDKRAISSIQIAAQEMLNIDQIKGKILCLEQIFLCLLQKLSGKVRDFVCLEPEVDRALSICFSCKQASSELKNCEDGLNSYINDIKKSAGDVLET